MIDDAREWMVIDALTQLAERGWNDSAQLASTGRISYENVEGTTITMPGRYDISDLEAAATNGLLQLGEPNENGTRSAAIARHGLEHINSIRTRPGWAAYTSDAARPVPE